MSGYPTVSYLEIDGKVLSGEEFEEYCKDHGLCRRCARVRTHRRVFKVFARGKKWEPMTLHDDMTGEYTVYKGYCLQPTCYTIGQAKRLLGETGSGRKSGSRKKLGDRFKKKGAMKRPSRRKLRTNPETESVMSGISDDDMSLASDVSGYSNYSAASGLSGMSGLSGIASSFRRRGGRKSRRSASAMSTASSVSSIDFSDDDTIDTTFTKDVNPVLQDGEVNPIVAHRVEQLTLYDYFTVLDLSKVELRPDDLEAVVSALVKTKTLENVTLDKCKLKDDGVERIMGGLAQGNHVNLKRLSLRQNSMGNRGASSLEFLLRKTTTLEELDLSENSISSRGAASILTALKNNPNHKLHFLNLSQNEIWDMDDGSFLRSNRTLKVFNLDGNFMHDEGAEQIANAIAENKHSVIEKLYLGWNGVSDDGASALARMMEINSSLQVLGLAENDISNTGARAILSALAVNTSVREISGLYHNQIDRKFIIVAIKRLLHRYGERTAQMPQQGAGQLDQIPTDVTTHTLRTDTETSPESSVNWASQGHSQSEETTKRTSVALEAIEHWDWGTFGIEEIEKKQKAVEKSQEVIEEQKDQAGDMDGKIGRVSLFRSAPLAYFNSQTKVHHDVPLFDFEYEARELEAAMADKTATGGAHIEFVHDTASQSSLSEFFSQGISPILHFSGHGHHDYLALENGFGYMQALSPEDLKSFVAQNKKVTQVAFVSSVHASLLSNAFLNAGIKHVVCCKREAVFRDEGPVEFAKAFYQALAKGKTLQDAFEDGLDAVKRSPIVKYSGSLAEKFQLLPKKSALPDYHKVEVFYKSVLPPKPEVTVGDTSMLPPLPKQFVGREVDMYEVLESLRVDDVIRVGGAKGMGKTTIVSAISRYILERPKSFGISSVYWLPSPPNVYPEENSPYADLCQVMDLLIAAEDDIWDEDLYVECRGRIMANMMKQKTVLVIDGRVFTTEIAGENLEKFLSHLLNEVSVKIILLTAHEGTKTARTKRSRSEETMMTMGPLDFKSSALLFGNACPHISVTGNPVAHNAEEFADFLVPPSMKKQGVDLNKALSERQKELYERMGKGNPKGIMQTAASISEEDLSALLRFAQRPDVVADSAELLKVELTKRTSEQERAIQGKNYLRAQDLKGALLELEGLKKLYPSLEDLQEKEKDLKKQFSDLLKARKLDEANKIKRKILALKKDMMKEKFSKPKASTPYQSGKLQQLQARMDDMMAQVNQMKLGQGDKEDATFLISRKGSTCALRISPGQSESYNYSGGICGIVCWTNENCDLSTYETGQKILGFGESNLEEDLAKLPELDSTEWGSVKCATGDAVIVGPRSYSRLAARYVVLSVPPLSPSNDDVEWDEGVPDEDALHYLHTSLRACFRSSFRRIQEVGLEAVGIPALSTKEGGRSYEKTLMVGLQTVIEEAKGTQLTSIHLLASSGTEAKVLIKLAMSMGMTCQL